MTGKSHPRGDLPQRFLWLALLASAAMAGCGDGGSTYSCDPRPGEWRTYAGGPCRRFFNPNETAITAANAGRLRVKWTFETGAIVTGSPSVVRLDVPGRGRIPVAFIQSWDANVYALDAREGTELWRFATAVQPGASFPNAASTDVQQVDGSERVFIGAGETLYCLDAVTGAEIWHFEAGTGCVDPPGLCGFGGERNEIESSPIVADGMVFFGMDVNDVEVGKGGFYALDAVDGRLVWYFDLETGSTCRPLPDDDVRRFDGYHSEEELGLPDGFFATREGCDFDRTVTGCGNIWSSASVDHGRRLLFFASSNCDTDDRPDTLKPPPPMPPYDEAIVALSFEGTPAWRWRPREVDNGDLAFGGVPNLFTIRLEGDRRADVVGVGNKDGTYYVLDREGVNSVTGVRWDDPDPSSLPYWSTRVVPGGDIGGIIATAAVDEEGGRIYFSTAPGFDPLSPQRPTVHALDKNTGEVIWQNTTEERADASYAPTSAIPGVVFVGSTLGGFLRAYDAATGERVARVEVGAAVASAPAVIDGLVMVGAGIGARSRYPESPQHVYSWMPQNVTALCVGGTPGCEELPATTTTTSSTTTVTSSSTSTSTTTVPGSSTTTVTTGSSTSTTAIATTTTSTTTTTLSSCGHEQCHAGRGAGRRRRARDAFVRRYRRLLLRTAGGSNASDG